MGASPCKDASETHVDEVDVANSRQMGASPCGDASETPADEVAVANSRQMGASPCRDASETPVSWGAMAKTGNKHQAMTGLTPFREFRHTPGREYLPELLFYRQGIPVVLNTIP